MPSPIPPTSLTLNAKSRILLLAVFVSLFGGISSATHATEADQIAFFEKHIRPVLIEHCYECHATEAKNIRGELLLDSRLASRRGGESGPAVVPGKPDESLLLSAMRHESFEMPPDKRLSSDIIANFEKWIADGATDPREGETIVDRRKIDIVSGREFWSFRPIEKPDPPTVNDTDWPASVIDQFVLAKIEAEQSKRDGVMLQPNALADPGTLLRRAKFDLVGLPPTPDEIATFLADPSDDAFSQFIDAWLNSRQYGERWGRHWMDVARFAESSGGGRSLMFPHAWRYRDYVIDAFNNDVPFDQFVREQIAGDLLPAEDQATRDRHAIATGFLALGPTNYELQDKEQLEMEVVDEQIDTIGRAFLGLTLGCVRCHDHKFDPIPMTDYYALAGIFTSTETVVHSNVSSYFESIVKTDPAFGAFLAADKKLKALEKEDKKQKQVLKALRANLQHEQADQNLPGRLIDDDQVRLTGKWTQSQFVPGFAGKYYVHASGKSDATATFPVNESGTSQLLLSYTPSGNRPKKVIVQVAHEDGESTVEIDQTRPPSFDGQFHLLGTYQVAKSVTIRAADASDGAVIVDALRVVQLSQLATREEQDASHVDHAKRQERVIRCKQEIASIVEQQSVLAREIKAAKAARGEKPIAMSVRDRQQTRNTQLRIRGEIRNMGHEVPRGFVSVASPPHLADGRPAPLALTSGESGRLQLAHWIASSQNPLTARVIVNRVWHFLLGEGIVRTPDSFGVMGQAPTHPELLDYLAADFMESGWSIKRLIRQIVLSRVYQLDSQVSGDAQDLDPDNRMLTRAKRRRLDAEAIRDSILHVSGQLQSFHGGRTIRKLAQYDLDYEFDTHKRSVYVPRFRNSILDIFQIFDVANPNLTTGRRPSSVLSTQALYLMNSPFVNQQARAAAESLLNTCDASTDARVEHAFMRTLGRVPTESEAQLVAEILRDGQRALDEQWTEIFHLLFGSIDFRYLY